MKEEIILLISDGCNEFVMHTHLKKNAIKFTMIFFRIQKSKFESNICKLSS